MELRMDIHWDGITLARPLNDEAVQIRQALADTAKHGDWPRVLDLLSEHREWVNSSRLDGSSWHTPLHQAAYLQTGDPLAGSPDPGSAGNGSLMRLSPVALRFWHDRPRLVATAAEHSRTTHGAEEAVGACRAFAELLADAIAGRPRADVLAPRRFEGSPAIARVMTGSWRGRARETIRSSGYVVHTLEAALWSVARTGDFRNAVLRAANLADDADTVAAVTGQLAGALYGLSGIPDRWLERVAWKDRLLEAAQRLVSASLPNREEESGE